MTNTQRWMVAGFALLVVCVGIFAGLVSVPYLREWAWRRYSLAHGCQGTGRTRTRMIDPRQTSGMTQMDVPPVTQVEWTCRDGERIWRDVWRY